MIITTMCIYIYIYIYTHTFSFAAPRAPARASGSQPAARCRKSAFLWLAPLL